MLDFDRSFGNFWNETSDFDSTDVILILDCYYSGTVARALSQDDRSVEIIAAVEIDQTALGDPSNQARLQRRTFTSRIADEIARIVGSTEQSSISFAEIISALRKNSNVDRMPEYFLRRGSMAIRVATPKMSRDRHSRHSESSSTDPISPGQNLMAVFKVHLTQVNCGSEEIALLMKWIHTLNPIIGLKVNGVFEGYSTQIILQAPWSVWAILNGMSGFELVCETFGGNQLQRILAQSRPPRPSALSENISPHL